MTQSDFLTVRIIRNELRERVAGFEQALFLQEQNCGGSKWLGDGCDVKARFRRVGDLEFGACLAIAFLEQNLSLLGKQDGTGEDVALDVGAQIGIDGALKFRVRRIS